MKTRLKLLVGGLVTVILVSGLAAFFLESRLGTPAVGDKSVTRVACVGDSITRDSDYPYALEKMLGANYTVGNFGVGGSTVSMDFRKPYLNQSECQDARNLEPDIVVMMLGTNDAYLSAQQRINLTNDYKTLISSFQGLPSEPKIFIVVPPPVFDNNVGLNATTLVDNVIPLVNQTAKDLGLPLIDVYTPLVNHPEDFLDGVHPNSQGAEIVATQVFNAINGTK